MSKKKILIMGAAGRDFHNFNVVFRGDPNIEVVAFTAAQIPNIEGRIYPPELAGPLYPRGIPIRPEEELNALISEHRIDEVVFSYSDVSHEYVMHKASQVIAAGADFKLLGARATMLRAKVPVISVCAVRTGCGKSPATRRVVKVLREKGRRLVVVRHPMPYGDLVRQRVQRFASFEDMLANNCTIEEMEEFTPHIERGTAVYAGVDYAEVLAAAEKEAEIIVWDGGNNDLPFFKPNLEIVLVDPHRPGHEASYFPGESNFRRAHVLIISKIATAKPENVEALRRSIAAVNPKAMVIEATLAIQAPGLDKLRDKAVLAIEDGPTLTHGEMRYGAGVIAARQAGARLVDPRPYAVGSIKQILERYPSIENLLPAMGYGKKQIEELQETINRTPCDAVVVATPVDLRRVININKPAYRVTYELEELGRPNLEDALRDF